VRWPPACEDVNPREKKRPLLQHVPKQRTKDRTLRTQSVCVKLFCKVYSQVVEVSNKSDYQSKLRLIVIPRDSIPRPEITDWFASTEMRWLAPRLTFHSCNPEMLASNLGWDTDYLDWYISLFFSAQWPGAARRRGVDGA
jgi:hypothetical protein